MTNKTELLPCPFCGKEPRYVTGCSVDTHGNDWPFAECDPCHVGSPVEFWNTRATPAEDVRAVGDEPVAWLLNPPPPLRAAAYVDFPQWATVYEVNPLYLHPQRPVVLPERARPQRWGEPLTDDEVKGWNACLDEFARLNP